MRTALLSTTVTALPTDGTLALADGTALAAGQALTSAQLAGLLFTPTPGAFDQTSTLAYTVADPEGNGTNALATLSIGRAVGNPAVSSESLSVPQNSNPVALNLSAPTDPNFSSSLLTTTVTALPTNGTLTLSDGTTAVTAGQQLSASQLAGLFFVPTPTAQGQGSAFVYSVADPDGNASTGTVSLAVVPPVYTHTTYAEGDAGGTLSTTGIDTVNIGNGDVTIHANGLSTTVNGGVGQMTFLGSGGDDAVTGGSGYSSVVAGSGGLTFAQGSGNVTVTANPLGQEVFNVVNGQAAGVLAIFGFVQGQDIVNFVGYPPSSIGQQPVIGAYDLGSPDGVRIILPSFVPNGPSPLFEQTSSPVHV